MTDHYHNAASDHFGLSSGQKDFNLHRIVRLAALATACKFAAFSVREGGHHVYLACFGEDWGVVQSDFTICNRVAETGEPVFMRSLHKLPDYRDLPVVAGGIGIRSYGGVLVLAADKSLLGVLCVMTDQDRSLDTVVNRRILVDCSRLIEDTVELRGEALRDGLTQLRNKRFFLERLGVEWMRARRNEDEITVLVIDIDHFKRYNDSLGHQAGDVALRRVADILGARVRRATDVVARFGGEEFVVLLPETGHVEGLQIAEQLCASVRRAAIPHPGTPRGTDPLLTISVGHCSLRVDAAVYESMTEEALFERADAALYKAKQAGRNCVRSAGEWLVQGQRAG